MQVPRRVDAPQTRQIVLSLDGMTCASCVGRVERTLTAVPGVTMAAVNLASETATVSYDPIMTAPDGLCAAVAKAGYHAQRQDRPVVTAIRHDAAAAQLWRQVVMAALLTLPVFILEMGSHVIPGMPALIHRTIGMQASWGVQFLLVSVLLAGPGRAFFAKGVPALLHGAPDMNALVAIGTGAAWGFSTVATFAPEVLPAGTRAVYFEAAAMIVTLILLGRYFEARAKGRAGVAIQNLIRLQPTTATIIANHRLIPKDIADIHVGEMIRTLPGQRIALDGIVTDGQSFVDESMISGEAVPVAKAAGDPVTGGTVNGAGTFDFKVTKTGDATMLAQIIRMVTDAQAAKLPIQDAVTRVTLWFVPAVLIIAGATVLLWLALGPDPALGLALVAGVSVLIVACPCALGLAVPTSIMVGTGRAAQAGVLFRKGDALQTLQQVQAVGFDKTGTLTRGQPALTALHVADGYDKDDLLQQIARVEAMSEHPVATAILRAAQDRDMALAPVAQFQSHSGFGVQAQVDGRTVMIGAARLLARDGIALDALDGAAQQLAKRGQTPVYVAVDGQLAAVIGISDPVKPGAHAAVAALTAMGLRVVMITGDHAATAQAVARQVGIADVVADVPPAGKVAALAALRPQGTQLAFIGDGINDAPALAHADVGIAIGTGTDVAIESADVVLMSGDPGAVVTAFDISRRTMRNIRQNLFWAFAYNIALIPVAAGGLYLFGGPLLSPMLAAGAMALSSLFVVTNGLRLR